MLKFAEETERVFDKAKIKAERLLNVTKDELKVAKARQAIN